MKLLIVLGLVAPLFCSAQQFGFGSFNSAPPKGLGRENNNNNNNWPGMDFGNNNMFAGFGGNSKGKGNQLGNNENLPGLDR